MINYRSNLEEAEAAAKEVEALGSTALVCQADVADREAVQAMFDQAIERFGRIDIVVANAAYSVREMVVDAKWENVYRTLEVSQFGTFHTCQFAAQHMIQQPLDGISRARSLLLARSWRKKPPLPTPHITCQRLRSIIWVRPWRPSLLHSISM